MMRLRLVPLVIAASVITLGAGSAAAPSAWSPQRAVRIDRLLQSLIDGNRIAGAVALVLQDGQPVYQRTAGWSDKEAGRRMTADAIFRIASQTKAVVSAAVLTLVEQGQIAIDDPASRFIPAFASTTVVRKSEVGVSIVPAKRPITIRDLLTHTSGISYGTDAIVASKYEAKGLGPAAGMGWYTADKDEPICDTVERLASLPFVAQPGEAWVYGYSLDVLGCIVERASGTTLDRYLAERITKPLAMTDTQFFLRADQRGRLATVYAPGPDGKIVRAPEGPKGQGNYVDGPRRSFSGGAGLTSTARDYARFLEMVRRGGTLGGVRVLAPRTVELMTTNQVGTLHSTSGLGFGFGFETTDRYGASGLEGVGGFGWGGAYGSVYRVDPGARLVTVLMIQLIAYPRDIQQRFLATVYQSLIDPVHPPAPSGPAGAF